jgi:hypothetical protein
MARSWFHRLRLGVLVAVLVGVLVFAWRDVNQRRSRNEWSRPLRVGIVVLELDRAGRGIEPEAIALLKRRAADLGRQLSAQYRRYHPRAEEMFEVVGYGPVRVKRPPPEPHGDGLWDTLVQTVELWRYVARVDDDADVPARGLDSRVYVVAEPVVDQRRKLVEGFSQQGGHFGVARVELDRSTVDLGLFVAAHELFHTLGATDKYDRAGATIIPDGLADPAQQPLFPQHVADVMTRNRVTDEGVEVVPETLAELGVGPLTAREVGWVR